MISVPEIYPTIGKLIDKNSKGEIEFKSHLKKCEALFGKLNDQSDYESLTEIEKEFLTTCDETIASYWDIHGQGCSWYCGGGLDTLSASSELKANKEISYDAKNAHDLSYKTAWIEGVDGYGIGEKLTYHFPPQNPRITKIIIVNGYVKSEKTWRENSRVKKLKMYLDGKPYAIMNLEDSRNEQEFEVDPIGESQRENWDELLTKSWWTMDFEILEVYKGDKYADTAITEIYFDGIDVH